MSLSIYHAPKGTQLRQSFSASPIRGVVFSNSVRKGQDVAGIVTTKYSMALIVCDGFGKDGEAIARAAAESLGGQPLTRYENQELRRGILSRLSKGSDGGTTISQVMITRDLPSYTAAVSYTGDSPVYAREGKRFVSTSHDFVYDRAINGPRAVTELTFNEYFKLRNFLIGSVTVADGRVFFHPMEYTNHFQAAFTDLPLPPQGLVIVGSDMLSKMLGVKTDRFGHVKDASGCKDLEYILGNTTDPEKAADLLIAAYEERRQRAENQDIFGVGKGGRVAFSNDDFTFIAATRDT